MCHLRNIIQMFDWKVCLPNRQAYGQTETQIRDKVIPKYGYALQVTQNCNIKRAKLEKDQLLLRLLYDFVRMHICLTRYMYFDWLVKLVVRFLFVLVATLQPRLRVSKPETWLWIILGTWSWTVAWFRVCILEFRLEILFFWLAVARKVHIEQ